MAIDIGRRQFIAALGGVGLARPLAARAQQAAMPIIGFLRTTTAAGSAHLVTAFRQGLSEAGFVEGQNVTIEYRWTDDQLNRLPGLAADLVRQRVAVIVASGPCGCCSGQSRSRDDADPPEIELQTRDAEQAGRAIGRQILIVKAASERDFNAAFATIIQAGAGALLVGGGAFFVSQRRQLDSIHDLQRAGLPAPRFLRGDRAIRRQLERQVGRLGASQDLVHIDRDAAEAVGLVDAVTPPGIGGAGLGVPFAPVTVTVSAYEVVQPSTTDNTATAMISAQAWRASLKRALAHKRPSAFVACQRQRSVSLFMIVLPLPTEGRSEHYATGYLCQRLQGWRR
jgi:hypothetical protein